MRRKLLQELKLSLSSCIDLCKATETTTSQVKAMEGHDVMANYVGKQSSPRRTTVDTQVLFQASNSVDVVIKETKSPGQY